MSDVIHPWERSKTETDEQWAAFRNYRNMLFPRRIASAACKDLVLLRQWSTDHDWLRRAAAYDRHVDAMIQTEKQNVLKNTEADRTARQLAVLLDAQDLAAGELRKLLAAAAENEGIGLLKPTDVVKLMQLAITSSRLIRGEATERVEVQDLSKLTDAELTALEALEEKIKVPE